MSKIGLWSCAAACKDGQEREVTGLYQGDHLLLVSRPWCAPASVPALRADVDRLWPLLASLISVADYHLHENAWYGEIAADWKTFAAICGLSRSRLGLNLHELMTGGFLHYTPGWGRVSASRVRLFPYNTKTGRRLLQVEPTWLHGFILRVEPRIALFEVETEGKSVEFTPVATARPLIGMGVQIGQAPVFIPGSVPHEPQTGAHAEEDSITLVFAERLRGFVPDDMYVYWTGRNPILRPNPDSTTSPSAGLVDETAPAVDWRQNQWSQGGVEIKVVDDEAAPEPGQLGTIPTWAIVADSDLSSRADDARVGMAHEPQSEAHGEVKPVPVHEPQSEAQCAIPEITTITAKEDHGHNHVGATSPNAGLMGGADAGALPPPPPAAPPAANARFVRSSSKRQLRQEELDSLYRLRGPRLSPDSRLDLPTGRLACIEAYERLAGLPFCRDDMAFLERALTLTSLRQVLRAIRDSSGWPGHNGGHFIMRDGMKHVLNYIQENRRLREKPKKSQVTSGIDKDLKDKIARRRAARVASETGASVNGVAQAQTEPEPVMPEPERRR